MKITKKKLVKRIVIISLCVIFLLFIIGSFFAVRSVFHDSFGRAEISEYTGYYRYEDYADKYEPYYYGVKVPIFCATEDGRRLLEVRLEHIGKPLTTNEYPRNKDDAPYKLL